MRGQVRGIVKIQRQFDGGGVRAGSEKSKLVVTFLVEVIAGERDGGVASNIRHWLKEEDILQRPNFVVEKATVVLLKDVSRRLKEGEAAYPAKILECMTVDSGKKRVEQTDKIRERPQLVRAKSLEDQMLQQSGYGTKGKPYHHSGNVGVTFHIQFQN